jgi:hypothetical protein
LKVSQTVSKPSSVTATALFCEGVSDMSIDNARPEENLIVAFTLAIAGALAAGLPMGSSYYLDLLLNVRRNVKRMAGEQRSAISAPPCSYLLRV